jgi:hypothetical protein
LVYRFTFLTKASTTNLETAPIAARKKHLDDKYFEAQQQRNRTIYSNNDNDGR